MQGLMMQLPLLISGLIAHADRNHGDTTIVSRLAEDPQGPLHRTTWRETHRRGRQLANALAHLGVRQGGRVATLAWNTHRHLELYYAVAGSGAVCHTVNPRLFDEQIAWILAHADAQVLFFDATFADIVARIAHKLPQVTHFVQMTGREHLPANFPRELLAYEDLVHRHSEHYAWPQLDENAASSLCYTSGTTGNPKGVLYSHRSTVLHAYACALPDSFGISARDTVMPVVPMYHVNAWGLPYIAALTGARLVLPGPLLDGASLHRLIVDEDVSFSNGVPTVWAGLLQHLAQHGGGLGRLRRLAIGGSACPLAMAESFARHGVEVLRTWGMTELSPIGTVNVPRADEATLAPERREAQGLTQGRPLPGVELAILDDDGQPLPHDGESFGELVARAVGTAPVLRARGRRRLHRRRLVPHRRRRDHRRGRLHADHRPRQGRNQVRRGVDQFDRAGEHSRRASGRRRSGGGRRAASEVGRAAADGGGAEAGRRTRPQCDARLLRRQDRALVAPRRPRRGGRDSAHRHRKDQQARAARALPHLPLAIAGSRRNSATVIACGPRPGPHGQPGRGQPAGQRRDCHELAPYPLRRGAAGGHQAHGETNEPKKHARRP